MSMKEINQYLDLMKDKKLKGAIIKYLEHYWDKFSKAPASISHHHNWSGGLISHTLDVLEIALRIVDALALTSEEVNNDHLIVACLLHDIGKITLYRQTETFAWEYITNKREYSHEIIPIIDFSKITGIALPEEISLAILGHMGGWSETSVYPHEILDGVLSSADLLSSRLYKTWWRNQFGKGNKV